METIKIKVGKSSIITLKSLAAAGYLWGFQVNRKDIILVSEEKPSAPQGNLRAGESIAEKFRIQGLKAGTARLIFTQKRSWEQNQAVSTLIFSVIVG